MAQIKVLNLDDSCSLYKLSYEDAKTVNGGAIGFGAAGIYSLWKGRRGKDVLRDAVKGGGIGALLGPKGASLSTSD